MSNFEQSPGWESEVPKYRVVRDLKPSPNDRHRLEAPFTSVFDSSVWQHATQPVKTGDEIETTDWPHSSFRPLNYSAERVLAFFNLETKSRLTRSPWFNGKIRLDNGLTNAPMITTAAILPQIPRPAA